MTNHISISSPINSPINILQNADNNNVTINQNIDQNVAEIIKSLEQLKQTIQNLPTDEKEDAEDFLNYIQEEIEKPSEQRDESKIVKNFKRFCKIAFPFVLGGIINGFDFTNNITDLASKFNVDLPQLPMIK
jgi:intergrase/recombinase